MEPATQQQPDHEKIICPLSTSEVVERILQFIEAFTEIRYYTYQSVFAFRVIQSVLDNDGAIISALWSRQSGKTESIADMTIGLAIILPALAKEYPDDPRFQSFRKGFKAGIYAPVMDQATISFERMRSRATSEYGIAFLNDPEINVQVTTSRGDTLAFSNGSLIIARTASPDSQIEGKTHHFIVCEEAQKLSRAKVDKEIRPMLASTNGTTVKIGTAWVSRGGFHHTIQLNQQLYEETGVRNHYEFPYDLVIAEKQRAFEKDGNHAHLNYRKFVDHEIFRLGGIDNEEFKMNFRCLWQESRVIAVQVTAFTKAAIKTLEAGPRKGGFQVAGLDIGKVSDSTVLTIMDVDKSSPIINPFTLPDADEDKQVYYPKTILDWLELQGNFEGNVGQYNQLIEYLRYTSVVVLVIDATSIGDPVYERIKAMIGGSIECVPFKFSGMQKSYLYKYYLQELHAGRIRYAAGETTQQTIKYQKFQREHLDLDKVEHMGYAVCQAPDGGHDDYPDSGALACWGEKVSGSVFMPNIEVSSDAPVWGGGRRSTAGSSSSSGFGSTLAGAISGRAGRYGRRW